MLVQVRSKRVEHNSVWRWQKLAYVGLDTPTQTHTHTSASTNAFICVDQWQQHISVIRMIKSAQKFYLFSWVSSTQTPRWSSEVIAAIKWINFILPKSYFYYDFFYSKGLVFEFVFLVFFLLTDIEYKWEVSISEWIFWNKTSEKHA